MTYNGDFRKDNQTRIDKEAMAGRCFYCHELVANDSTAFHLSNARGITQHIHGECDKNLREELAFEAYQEQQLEAMWR